jgi:uncharacterized membrane-anchored protein YhcB (DUF1043 family)
MPKHLVETLKSQAFLEKLLLLLAAALLTGFLVPEVTARLAAARIKEQKSFEAELQRQRDVIAEQSRSLQTLSKALWTFVLLNIDVSFYKVQGNEASYLTAVGRYQSQSAQLLASIRTEMSNARRLTTPTMYERLSDLYYKTLIPIDGQLEALIQRGAAVDTTDWHRQNAAAYQDAQKAIDDLLNDLAVEFQLTAHGPHSRASNHQRIGKD